MSESISMGDLEWEGPVLEAEGEREAKGSSSLSGDREGRPESRGTLNPLLSFEVCLPLSFALVELFDIESVDLRAVVDLGFVGFLVSEAEGRGGLNAFGGIVIWLLGGWEVVYVELCCVGGGEVGGVAELVGGIDAFGS